MKFTRSLRFRLTAWYCGALTLLLVAFGAILFGIIHHHLLRHHDAPLQLEAGRVLTVLGEQEDCRNLTPFQAEKLGQGAGLLLLHQVEGKEEAFFVSPEMAANPILKKMTALVMRNPTLPQFDTIEEGGIPWRVLSLPYQSSTGRQGVIRVTEDLGDFQDILVDLKMALIILAPVVIAVSCLGGTFLAGKALAPVDRITTLAREIEANQLDRRLPHPGVDCEIGRLVETLNHMFARLESSFDAMKSFTANASHELRSPLATMRNTLEIMVDQPRSVAEHLETLQSLIEEVERLGSIVEDLLLLARADAGRVIMKLAPVRLDRIMEQQVEAHLPQAESHGVVLEIGTSTPAEIMGDDRWLHQLLSNLIGNALTFTPQGQGVQVSLTRDSAGIRLAIQDSGPGIPEKDLQRVFERFYRSDASRSRESAGGSGLGLAICSWIAEAHGARIWAFNGVGGGAVLTVLFQTHPGPPS